jgi:hypothetical protein
VPSVRPGFRARPERRAQWDPLVQSELRVRRAQPDPKVPLDQLVQSGQ